MRIVIALAAIVGLSACDTPNFRTSQFQFGDSTTLAATGNLRLVTERERRLPHNTARVMCSEPSPDYATESGTDLSGAIKSAAAQSPISEANGSVKTTEVIHELQGRSKGVLALRDGLYAACQAYVNGLIGKDAYSIILSQYGILLVGLLQEPSPITINGDAKKSPVINIKPQATSSAFAVLLVSCINQYDPTRRDYSTAEAPYDYNAMLSRSTCRSVMERAGKGQAG